MSNHIYDFVLIGFPWAQWNKFIKKCVNLNTPSVVYQRTHVRYQNIPRSSLENKSRYWSWYPYVLHICFVFTLRKVNIYSNKNINPLKRYCMILSNLLTTHKRHEIFILSGLKIYETLLSYQRRVICYFWRIGKTSSGHLFRFTKRVLEKAEISKFKWSRFAPKVASIRSKVILASLYKNSELCHSTCS